MVCKKKKRRQSGVGIVAVLVLIVLGWPFMPANAEEDCATDFFSQKTCRTFDTMDWGIESRDPGKVTEGFILWNDGSGFSGSQIWYRNILDGNWNSLAPRDRRDREALGNPAIHRFRCASDLFGNVICSPNQMVLETPLEQD